jgi:hypothetical protein
MDDGNRPGTQSKSRLRPRQVQGRGLKTGEAFVNLPDVFGAVTQAQEMTQFKPRGANRRTVLVRLEPIQSVDKLLVKRRESLYQFFECAALYHDQASTSEASARVTFFGRF